MCFGYQNLSSIQFYCLFYDEAFKRFRNRSLTINLVLLFIDMTEWNLFLLFWGQCSPREDHLDINT